MHIGPLSEAVAIAFVLDPLGTLSLGCCLARHSRSAAVAAGNTDEERGDEILEVVQHIQQVLAAVVETLGEEEEVRLLFPPMA